MTEHVSNPHRTITGEAPVLTVGQLLVALTDESVNPDWMVTMATTGELLVDGWFCHIRGFDVPDPDPSGDYSCDPDGPQTVVLHPGQPFDGRDF